MYASEPVRAPNRRATFAADGQSLVYSTYVGGRGGRNESNNTLTIRDGLVGGRSIFVPDLSEAPPRVLRNGTPCASGLQALLVSKGAASLSIAEEFSAVCPPGQMDEKDYWSFAHAR